MAKYLDIYTMAKTDMNIAIIKFYEYLQTLGIDEDRTQDIAISFIKDIAIELPTVDNNPKKSRFNKRFDYSNYTKGYTEQPKECITYVPMNSVQYTITEDMEHVIEYYIFNIEGYEDYYKDVLFRHVILEESAYDISKVYSKTTGRINQICLKGLIKIRYYLYKNYGLSYEVNRSNGRYQVINLWYKYRNYYSTNSRTSSGFVHKYRYDKSLYKTADMLISSPRYKSIATTYSKLAHYLNSYSNYIEELQAYVHHYQFKLYNLYAIEAYRLLYINKSDLMISAAMVDDFNKNYKKLSNIPTDLFKNYSKERIKEIEEDLYVKCLDRNTKIRDALKESYDDLMFLKERFPNVFENAFFMVSAWTRKYGFLLELNDLLPTVLDIHDNEYWL